MNRDKNRLLKASRVLYVITAIFFLLSLNCVAQEGWRRYYRISVPFLESEPEIDGNLSEWKDHSFCDGTWDINRLRYVPWYNPAINRLTDHGNEPSPAEDLSARYYFAWDNNYLYLGAEVRDNVNDVTDPAHKPERWFFKDAVCWFIEAPCHHSSKSFALADNAFCFVIDTAKPSYGAWWRHGEKNRTYVEEPLPSDAVSYSIIMNSFNKSRGDFTLEARIRMDKTFPVSDPGWTPPVEGDEYGIQIVNTDPDGGDYGGHFLIYGNGDDDATWGRMRFTGPLKPLKR